jgi:hypothetical protein
MPGIVGIIKPFDMGGTFSIREMGTYKGWMGMKNQDKRPTNALIAKSCRALRRQGSVHI